MAFLQASPPRQPFFRAPSAVLWLAAALAVAHAVRATSSRAASQAAIDTYGFVPAHYAHILQAAPNFASIWGKLLPFISHLGLHPDVTSLGIDCLWLLAFGTVVGRRFRGPLFLAFFLACGIAGAAVYLAVNWGSPIPLLGSTGAVAGLMAAATRMLPSQTPWALPGETPLAPILSPTVLIISALLAALLLFWGILGAETDWPAQLGGYVAGLTLCGPFDALRPRQPMPLND